MHRLFEVDGIQNLDSIRFINDLTMLVFQGLSVLAQLWRSSLKHLSALD